MLCPTTHGEVGTRQLNSSLLQLLNPAKPVKAELSRGGSILRVGDRVIQQVHDYQREVFNGDLGTIASMTVRHSPFAIIFLPLSARRSVDVLPRAIQLPAAAQLR